MSIERIQELANRIERLASDPQPGLFTWHIALEEAVNTLVQEWFAKRGDII